MTEHEILRARLDEIGQSVAESRGDYREGFAELKGAINTLAAVKAGEHKQLSNEISDVRHDHANTKVEVKRIQANFGEYPKAERINAVFQIVEDIKTWRNKMLGAALVLATIVSILSGIVVAWSASLF